MVPLVKLFILFIKKTPCRHVTIPDYVIVDSHIFLFREDKKCFASKPKTWVPIPDDIYGENYIAAYKLLFIFEYKNIS